jgi:hypothetical protein
MVNVNNWSPGTRRKGIITHISDLALFGFNLTSPANKNWHKAYMYTMRER